MSNLKPQRMVIDRGIKTLDELKRNAVRNMVRNGVSERMALAITGHKTLVRSS